MERFARGVVVIGPGAVRACDAPEWRDASVVVERGVVELEGAAGARERFGPGAVVTLDGVAACALRNRGDGPAVLVTVARRLRALA